LISERVGGDIRVVTNSPHILHPPHGDPDQQANAEIQMNPMRRHSREGFRIENPVFPCAALRPIVSLSILLKPLQRGKSVGRRLVGHPGISPERIFRPGAVFSHNDLILFRIARNNLAIKWLGTSR
jgi:hypothetical protein